MEKVRIVILAAGKGTRMKSELPKALMPLCDKPMVKYVLDTAENISSYKPIMIVGYQADLVKKELANSCEYVLQEKQLGTGHALSCAEEKSVGAEQIVVLSSDQPLIKKETILRCLSEHEKTGAKITFASTEVLDFNDWRKYFFTHGRILKKNERVVDIREFKNASEDEKKIREVNTGCCYVFDTDWVWNNLKKIKNDNAQGEYLLTDLIELAATENSQIQTVKISPEEALGANSKEELEILEKFIV